MAARSTTGPDAERKAVSDVHETGLPCAGQAVSHGTQGRESVSTSLQGVAA